MTRRRFLAIRIGGATLEQRGQPRLASEDDWSWGTADRPPAPEGSGPAGPDLTSDAPLRQLPPRLTRGGHVWLLPDGAAVDPPRLLHLLGQRSRVALNCVPSLWRSMLDEIEAGLWTKRHTDRNRAIEVDDRRRRDRRERLIQRGDTRPVGLVRRARSRMARGNRGLQEIRP